jgi:outer membrane receptor protein involved in Fe transport
VSEAAIRGRILDSLGDPLPGVTVEAKHATLRLPIAVSNSDGTFAIETSGATVDLSFRLVDFATSVHRNVADGSRVDVTMYLTSSSSVVVTGKRTFRTLADLDVPVNDLIGLADAASVGVVTQAEIDRQPVQRPADVIETVPGVIISQHSGEGKANQYYLRGFNLDHGTDVAIRVAGVPVNMPTHGHGQGYADLNFLIPELVSAIQYRKGSYSAEDGDFASAGAVHMNYLNTIERPFGTVTAGRFDYRRAVFAASPKVGPGNLLFGIEASESDGPWIRPDDYHKLNGILRYSIGGQRQGASITFMTYDAKWNATDQIPARAIDSGAVDRFGLIDDTDGGESSRHSLAGSWQRSGGSSTTQLDTYAIDYRMNLFSNFTYFLDDPVNGDQFEQIDDRIVSGGRLTHRWLTSAGRFDGESLLGAEIRHDKISKVGLYKTRRRQRLSTVREDSVDQWSGAVFVENSTQWSRFFRSVAGLRFDSYRFDIESDLYENSGEASDSLLSPKLSMIFGPFRNSELYVNAGSGFHSNDGRGTTTRVDPRTGDRLDPVDALVRTTAAEIGVRTKPASSVVTTVSIWTLGIDSELLFIGDAGTTEASRPSRRSGIELETQYRPLSWLLFDAEASVSRARFTDDGPAGDHVPGAAEAIASAGVSVVDLRGSTFALRYRFFGSRSLIEDDSVRSPSSSLFNASFGYRPSPRYRLELDVINLLDDDASDIDYFYTSRLPGERDEGFDDFHLHPIEPRQLRLSLTIQL